MTLCSEPLFDDAATFLFRERILGVVAGEGGDGISGFCWLGWGDFLLDRGDDGDGGDDDGGDDDDRSGAAHEMSSPG